MKSFRIISLAAFSMLAFAACQQAEIAPEETPDATHTVTFVAGAPETKTTVTIKGSTAKFAWTKADENRFTVYENGTAATETIGVLGEDGKMTLSATFDGTTPASPNYQALYNTAVSSTQTANDLYDETADVLVSAVLNDIDRDAVSYFSFKRESAIAKMTLKGLTDGAFVSSVTINSDKAIAGTYELANGSFSSTSNTITITSLSEITGGEATVWFASVPVEGATFTVTATAVDNNENVVATYTKTFSKTITLTRGDVKGFGVKMTKDVSKTYGYQKISEVSDYTPGDYIIVAHVYKEDCPKKGDFAISNELSLSSDKLLGEEVTNLIDNDVISVLDGASYKLSLSGDKDNIVISNGTKTLAYKSSTDLVLDGDNKYWTLSLNEGNGGTFLLLNNSTAKATTKRALSFQSYSKNGTTKTASLKFGAYAASNMNNVDYAAIELYKYKEVTPSTPKYSVTFAEITGGTLSATPSKAEAGAEVTLIATPDAEYTFNNDWTVTNAETSDAITVTDGKFTMPAANVTVSASFTQNTYAITANTAENGTYTVKVGDAKVTSAVKDAKVVLEATPAEGYICDGWTVLDAEGNSVTVSNNSFYMPASAVTISTSFSLKPNIKYEHAGTAEDPYSVADVLKYISTLGTETSTEDVYVKGVITYIKEVSTSYGNATYKIKDEDVENEVLVYHGYYLNGAKFTSEDQIRVGDEVVVKGKVKNYNDIPEFDSKNSIVSIVKAPYLNVTASKESGIVAAGETVTITVDTNVDSWNATSDNKAFVVGTQSGNTVDVVVSKNTDATERKATITVTAGSLSKTITLTQSGASSSKWVLVEDINSLTEGTYILASIKTIDTWRYMPNTESSGANPTLKALTAPDNNTIADEIVSSDMKWDLVSTGSDNQYYIRPNGNSSIGLGCTSSTGKYIRISSSYKDVKWTFSKSTSANWIIKNDATTAMYLAVYADDAWRNYSNSTTNQNGKFYLFKQVAK